MAQQRVNEAKKLGFNTCVMPEISLGKMGKVDGMRLIGVGNVREAIVRVMG
jgi:DNA repair protein RadA/Sms